MNTLKTTENNLPVNFNSAQINLLTNKTPAEHVYQRRGKGYIMMDYVKIGYVIDQLNLICGYKWSFEVLSEKLLDNEVIVRGRLSIQLREGSIIKENYGTASIKKSKTDQKIISVGDDLKAATSDSLKKCASMLGLAADVYSPQSTETIDNKENDSIKTKHEKNKQIEYAEKNVENTEDWSKWV